MVLRTPKLLSMHVTRRILHGVAIAPADWSLVVLQAHQVQSVLQYFRIAL